MKSQNNGLGKCEFKSDLILWLTKNRVYKAVHKLCITDGGEVKHLHGDLIKIVSKAFSLASHRGFSFG